MVLLVAENTDAAAHTKYKIMTRCSFIVRWYLDGKQLTTSRGSNSLPVLTETLSQNCA